MRFAKWAVVGVGVLVVFAVGLWWGSSGLTRASQPSAQISVAPQVRFAVRANILDQ